MNIAFQVPALPVAQPRQRTRVMMIGGRPIAQNYTSKDSPIATFKATVKHAASQAYQGSPLQGPLQATLVFVFPRPGNMQWKTKPMLRLPKPSKPDADNLAKGVLDALNGLLFVDDSQICDVTVRKVIASGGEQPHVEIAIAKL